MLKHIRGVDCVAVLDPGLASASRQPHGLTASQPAGRLVEMQLILILVRRAQLFLPMSRVGARVQ
jgi:hypothetical protein